MIQNSFPVMKYEYVEFVVVLIISAFLFWIYPNFLMAFGCGLLLGAFLIEKVYF